MIEKNTWVALALLFTTLTAVSAKSDLPPGVLRGPLLREHSFADPLVTDWWTEGVPHYMIGGSAVANEHFMRLTTHTLDDHGFAFNTAPMDHDNWEVRMKFSVRPPAEAARNQDELDDYQGGDGIALWYLRQPIGDDHQHVVKYSKPISAEVMTDRADKENPWRFADEILMDDNDEDELDELDDLDDLTEVEKKQMAEDKERRAVQRRRREELFRKLFKRGTSIDDDNVEPRIMGVKYSDFSGGFAIVLDSVGEEEEHTKHHHRHTSSIYLLLNLPNHTAGDVQNNFNPSRTNFRQSPKILQCAYDFRQNATKMYDPSVAQKDETTRLLQAVEQPLELVVRYHEKKLSILVIREDVSQRKIIKTEKGGVDVQRGYVETLCGEAHPITLPLGYHLGLSAATGHRTNKERKFQPIESLFYEPHQEALMHVDVHDVFSLQLRELGRDPKQMGYSKTVPIEHFDFAGDMKKREHFSRQIPEEPDADK